MLVTLVLGSDSAAHVDPLASLREAVNHLLAEGEDIGDRVVWMLNEGTASTGWPRWPSADAGITVRGSKPRSPSSWRPSAAPSAVASWLRSSPQEV